MEQNRLKSINGFPLPKLEKLSSKSILYICALVTSLLQLHSIPFSEGQRLKLNDNVRLAKSVIPDTYELKLIPFIFEGNFTFNGEEKILVNVTEATRHITLNALDLKIDRSATYVKEYDSHGRTKFLTILNQKDDAFKQHFIIETSEYLRPQKQYALFLKFIGKLNDQLRGFYRSSYKVNNQTRWIAATQFEPTDARRAFPCFDEPAFKASFQISIARPKNMIAISNMPRKKQSKSVLEISSYEWDIFERSVPMSTYLVAFIIFDFQVLQSDDGNFRVWARSGALNQSRYSLDIGPKILKYYEDFFRIKFPLPKMDMVAIPDFSAGAMENWGLITYRETAMLYQEGISTVSNQQGIAGVVAHELAHQWFGNLVTPEWWSDLWLNEGFASYVEYIGMNSVEPDWLVLEQFVVHELQTVFSLDALRSSHPISVEVHNPDEINEIFDWISYNKGASIIRMMDHFLTREVFRKGLTKYLNKKAYGNAKQDDLWAALTEQAHEDQVLEKDVTVKEIMDTWTLQTGFPVVTVNRDYNGSGASLIQERFILENDNTTTLPEDDSKWWVPITYTSEKVLDFNSTRPLYWMNNEKSLLIEDIGASSSQWVIFNILETGYYRVNYDERNWQMLIEKLGKSSYKDISTINRAQLIDDAFNLARAGRLNYATALDVTSYLVKESEYLPWKAALTSLGYLNNMLINVRGYDRFRRLPPDSTLIEVSVLELEGLMSKDKCLFVSIQIYALELLDNIYSRVGFKDSKDDPQLTVFTRVDILSWACSFGHEDCVRNAVKQFSDWQDSLNPDENNPISPNLKSVVYCTAIRVGGLLEWEFAWERYLKTNIATEKDLLLSALGCTRETWLLSRYMDWAVTDNSGIKKQDASRVFGSVANNEIGKSLAFNYLRNRWSEIRNYIDTSLTTLSNIVKSATRRLNTKYELKELIEFAAEHVTDLGSSTRALQQAIEQTGANVKWLERNQVTIQKWLGRYNA